jgi:secretion/DNA translocation related TadE-like protein
VSSRRRGAQGATTVVALGLVGLLLVVAAVATGTTAIVLAHRRAQVAADLASLAAAGALQAGTDPCGSAAAIAARHDADLTGCRVDGFDVVVTTGVTLPPALGGRAVVARARAGPVTPSGLP